MSGQWERWLRTFFCSREKNDSIAALSAHVYAWPIERWIPVARQASMYWREPNCEPLSECMITSRGLPRRCQASSSASTASEARILEFTGHPTIRLLHTSLTAHRYSLPWLVQCSSDVGQPHDVGSIGMELAAHEVIRRGLAGRLARAVATLDRGAYPILRTDAPHATLRHAHVPGMQFVTDQSIPNTHGSSA